MNEALRLVVWLAWFVDYETQTVEGVYLNEEQAIARVSEERQRYPSYTYEVSKHTVGDDEQGKVVWRDGDRIAR